MKIIVKRGATIVNTAQEVFEKATLIVKVKEPQAQETAMLKPHHVLFTYLHLAPNKPLTSNYSKVVAQR
jgi:alanine dehydrogenase